MARIIPVFLYLGMLCDSKHDAITEDEDEDTAD
jgi:hypothetical protein